MVSTPRSFAWSVLLVAALVGGSSVFVPQPAEAGHSSSHNAQFYCGFSVNLPSSTAASGATSVVRVSYCQTYPGWTTIQVFRDGERVEKEEWHTSSNTWRTVDISFPAGSAGAKEIWVYGLADRDSSDPRPGYQNFNGHAGTLTVDSQSQTTPPDAPTGLSATPVNSNTIDLDWTAPSDNGGASITGYKVYRKIAGTSWAGDAHIGDTTATSYRDTGSDVDCETTYTYDVTAINSVGESEYSNEATATTSACPNIAPGSPTNLRPGTYSTFDYEKGEQLVTSSPRLSWHAPSGGADYYKVWVRETPPNGPLVVNGQQTTSAYIDTSLKCDTTYRWNMAAFNHPNEEGPTTPAHPARMYFTTVDCESEPADLVIAYNGIMFNPSPPVEGRDVDVTCQYSNSPNGGTANSGFDVKVTIDGASKSTTGSALSPGSSDSRTLTFGSYPQGPHTVACEVNTNRVVTESNYANSGYTLSPTQHWDPPTTAVPSVPPHPNPGASSAPGSVESTTPTLQWSEAQNANNYHVKVFDAPSGSVVDEQTYHGSLSYAVPSGTLQTGQGYYWQVRACNSDTGQCSSFTDRLYFTTQEENTSPQASQPDAPTGLHPGVKAAASASSTVGDSLDGLTTILRWTAPSGAVEGYRVYLNKEPYNFPATYNGVQVTTTSWTTPTLDCGTTYRWQVEAYNSAGTGALGPTPTTDRMYFTTKDCDPTDDTDSTDSECRTQFNARRPDIRIDAIVIHTGENPSFDGLVADLRCNDRMVSAHYVVGDHGEVASIISEDKRAWHTTYYNDRSIGIELQGFAGQPEWWDPITKTAKYEALAELVRDIAQKYNIPMVHVDGAASGWHRGAGSDAAHGFSYSACVSTPASGVCDHYHTPMNTGGIIGHNQIQPLQKSDPGPYFDWQQFMALVHGDEAAPSSAQAAESERSGTGYFFIHGICSTGDMWTSPDENGHAVWAPLTTGGVPYMAPTYGPDTGQVIPRDQVAFLKEQLEQFLDSKNLAHVVLVGHSNGGLMARALLAAEVGTQYEQLIERVVTIDSPDLGGHKTFPEYYAFWDFKCNDYEGGTDSGWVPYTMNFLDREGNPGVGWMTGDFPGLAALSTDSSKVIRLVFGECWGHWTERPLSLIRPSLSAGCMNGEKLAVQPYDANMEGAVLLAFARNTDGNPGLDAARAACEPGGTFSAPTSEIRAVGIRKSTPPLVGIYHSWGIDYHASLITAAAEDGILGLIGAGAYDCSVLNRFAVGTVAGVITLSASSQSESLTLSGGAELRRTPPVQTQAYNTGFTMTAEPSENKLSLVRMKVNSPTSDGKIVVVNADVALWTAADSRIGVWLDDRPVQEAKDYADLTSDTSATSAAKYLLVKGAVGYQFLIWVPHFSERTIEIALVEEAGQSFVIPPANTALTAGAILVARVAYRMRRR